MSTSTPVTQDEPESPIEENTNIPSIAQDSIEDEELPLLVLISHGHSPPLNPKPQLKFDIRDLPNPPKAIRDQFSGTSRRLREWTAKDEKFVSRRDVIKREIEGEMGRMVGQGEGGNSQPSGDEQAGEGTELADIAMVDEQSMAENEVTNDSPSEDDDEADNSEDSASESSDALDRDGLSFLRVGVSCGMGKHRSVAMVEELARLSWPGWRVEIQHRDIDKKRGVGKKNGGKAGRGTRGGGMPSQLEDD